MTYRIAHSARVSVLLSVVFIAVIQTCATADTLPDDLQLTERQKKPDLVWWRESMKTRDQRLAWWEDARFGMFIHWGVYSEPGGEWKGRPVGGYAEHLMRKCKIPRAE